MSHALPARASEVGAPRSPPDAPDTMPRNPSYRIGVQDMVTRTTSSLTTSHKVWQSVQRAPCFNSCSVQCYDTSAPPLVMPLASVRCLHAAGTPMIHACHCNTINYITAGGLYYSRWGHACPLSRHKRHVLDRPHSALTVCLGCRNPSLPRRPLRPGQTLQPATPPSADPTPAAHAPAPLTSPPRPRSGPEP